MGGSLAGAATAAGWRVLLHHHRPDVARQAADRGWGTAITDFAAAQAADLAVVCTPVGIIPATVRAIAAVTSAVITDVGSTKAGICAALADLGPRFVGSHPMCGSHLQGLAHADPLLYRGRLTIITGCSGTSDHATGRDPVERLWRDLGCRIMHLAPDAHDRVVAEASHLPHILASLAAGQLTDEAVPACAGGFRDTTRIAAASPDLWRDILVANAAALLPLVADCRDRLATLEAALLAADGAAVAGWLKTGHDRRMRYESQQPKDTRS
jgi:prephenate dehydrogenase